MRGVLTVPCCFVSAAHAAGTGIPYCLPGHWPGSAGGRFLAPRHVTDSQLDPQQGIIANESVKHHWFEEREKLS